MATKKLTQNERIKRTIERRERLKNREKSGPIPQTKAKIPQKGECATFIQSLSDELIESSGAPTAALIVWIYRQLGNKPARVDMGKLQAAVPNVPSFIRAVFNEKSRRKKVST